MKKSLTGWPLYVKERNRDSCTCSQGCGAHGKSCEIRGEDCKGEKRLKEFLTSKKTAYPEKVTV